MLCLCTVWVVVVYGQCSSLLKSPAKACFHRDAWHRHFYISSVADAVAFGWFGYEAGSLSGVWLPSNCSARYVQRGCMTEITGFVVPEAPRKNTIWNNPQA